MANTSFNLSPYWDAFIKEQVASGRYGSASEVMREALRLMETRDRRAADFYAHVQEGIDDFRAGRVGPPPTRDELWAEVDRRKAARRAKAG